MYSLLVMATGMYDGAGKLPTTATARLDAALAWARTHEGTTLYTAAYLPPEWPYEGPPLSVVMEQYLVMNGAGQTAALIEPVNFNTKAEVRQFLNNATEPLAIVSSRFHLPRIFVYVWEAKGWRTARDVTYVAVTDERNSWLLWPVEFTKIAVIALPYSLQRRLEYWYAKRTHTQRDIVVS